MPRVLVIDDNPDFIDFVTLLLKMNNFEVRSIFSREDVAPILKIFNPDIILIDVRLGSVDGREVCKDIRKVNKDTPIILLSASPEKLKNYAECGACDFIEKPFEITEITTKINKALKAV